MKFLLIWYKDSFRVPDMKFNQKKEGSLRLFSSYGNQNIRVYIAEGLYISVTIT